MDYRINKNRWSIFAAYDVELAIPVITSIDPIELGKERFMRVGGPFWTKRGAQKWIDKEGGQD